MHLLSCIQSGLLVFGKGIKMRKYLISICIKYHYLSIVLALGILTSGFSPKKGSNPSDEPEKNQWHSWFMEVSVGEYPDMVPKRLIEASKELLLSGALPEIMFNKKVAWGLYEAGLGPSLQNFRSNGESDQAAGLYANVFYEDNIPYKMMDASNLIIWEPDTSQAVAVLIPNSVKIDKEFTIASYYLLNGRR